MPDVTLFERHAEIFNSDIGLYYCGQRIRSKGHVYGPQIRSHFLLVLVEKGNAVLCGEQGETEFGDRDMLVMFPDEKVFYKTRTDWTIKWIGVSGTGLHGVFAKLGVTREKPVFKPENYDSLSQIMSDIYQASAASSLSAKYKIQSLLCEFFATLLSETDKKENSDHVTSAIEIIRYNYNNELNIKNLADSLFLDSAYFSRLFKSRVGMSPKQYIQHVRLQKAKELLEKTDYSVKEIAITVGFADPLYFSKQFSKAENMTPTEFRKLHKV